MTAMTAMLAAAAIRFAPVAAIRLKLPELKV
jgi:hypothetical protein